MFARVGYDIVLIVAPSIVIQRFTFDPKDRSCPDVPVTVGWWPTPS